eukprot:14053261-Heterocapsa_arctica.AAC.1
MDPSEAELAQMRAGGNPLVAAIAYAGASAATIAALRSSLGDFQRCGPPWGTTTVPRPRAGA